MTFLNAALVAGVLAFNVPLIIHLLNKSRYTRVDWGAMFLLEQVVRQNRRRVRLEQIIMLLVRCAIPVLLALAMAQPVINGWQKLLGSSPGSTVVMLDASYSMQARDPGSNGRSRFDAARDRTRAVFDAMPDGSRGTVIRVGGGFDPVTQTLTPELDRVGNRLDALEADLGVADGPAALRRGVESLADANTNTLKRDLVLVSDFQRVSWAKDSGVQRQRLVELVDQMKVKPAIVLMPVGDRPGRNLAVMSAALSSDAVGVGQRVRVVATVLNTSDQPAPDTPVTLKIDGAERETQRLSIDAGQSADVVFFHAFDAGGPHTLEVAVNDGVLPADDVYHIAVNVIQSLPVLLVSPDAGRPRLPFPENETDFLEVALQPFAASADAPLADLIHTTVVGPQAISAQTLKGQRVVVFANAPGLTDQQAALLRAFVEHGGALVVFPGDRIDVQAFNRVLYAGDKGLSPASITGLTGKGLGFDEGATLLDQRHEHPALALWNDPANGSLSDATFDVWYELEPAKDAQVVARLSTGHPFLVRQEVGEGVVLVGASSIDAGWGNLPTRPMYLPLMQRLVAFAATHAEPPSNVALGRPLVALLDTGDEGRNPKEADWLTPAGERIIRPIEARGGRRVCTLDSAPLPGYYRLLIDGKAERVFAVNAPRDESDLDRLTDQEIDQLAAAVGATVVRDADTYAQIDRDRRHGRPVWRVLWALALALVFGELLLQQWFGKGGRG